MRNRKAFLSCIASAALGLLAATTVMATGDDDSSTCINPSTPIVTVVAGPCPVSSLTSTTCSGEGDFTGIQYQITLSGLTDVATLVTANNTEANGSPLPACKGDSKTGLGKNSCHERAVKPIVTTVGTVKTFWVIVGGGRKQPINTTVAGKKSGKVYCSERVGLGLDLPEGCVSTCGNFNPKQAVKNIQIVVWEGCEIRKIFDPTTGAFLGVELSVGSACTVVKGEFEGDGPQPVTNLLIRDTTTVDPEEAVTFGDGDTTSGDNSCINTFVGGKYARVCKP